MRRPKAHFGGESGGRIEGAPCTGARHSLNDRRRLMPGTAPQPDLANTR